MFRLCSVFHVPCVKNFAFNIYYPQPPLSPSFILLSSLCLLWISFLKFSVWWLQFLQQENEFTVTPLPSLVDSSCHPGAPMLSLDEIGGTPGRTCFSLVQIRRRHCLLAADKLMLSPNSILLIFTFFIQTPIYYTFLESFWAEEFNKIVFNMF